jgi:hypothetical protein
MKGSLVRLRLREDSRVAAQRALRTLARAAGVLLTLCRHRVPRRCRCRQEGLRSSRCTYHVAFTMLLHITVSIRGHRVVCDLDARRGTQHHVQEHPEAAMLHAPDHGSAMQPPQHTAGRRSTQRNLLDSWLSVLMAAHTHLRPRWTLF